MKTSLCKKALSALMALAIVLSVLPVQVFSGTQGRFCLVVEASGSLVIPPEYVSYEEGMTVREALLASGHTFRGIDSGNITMIDGEEGNYNRYDEDNEYQLDKSAAEVSFYRFSEGASGGPSAALQSLMTAMAEWKIADDDVQMAANDEYQDAVKHFVGASDSTAQQLANALTSAMEAYREAQKHPFSMNFFVLNAQNEPLTITATNSYGKTYNNEDGKTTLKLPAGQYTYMVSHEDGYHISGTQTVTGNTTVTLALPIGEDWLNTENLLVAGNLGDDFDEDLFPLGEWDGRKASVFVRDSFAGKVYLYVEHNLESTPKLTALYTDTRDNDREEELTFGSKKVGLDKLLATGAEGNTLTLRVSVTEEESGTTQSVDYTVELDRIPSLTDIKLTDEKGSGLTADRKFSPGETDYLYRVVDSVKTVTVKPVPFADGYAVAVNGEEASDGVDVTLEAEGDTHIEVAVTGRGATTTYFLTVRPGAGQKVDFMTDFGVELVVVNSQDEVLPYTLFKEGDEYYRYRYTLVPGDQYSYVARQTCYGVKGTIELEELSGTVVNIEVPTEDWLTGLELSNSNVFYNSNLLPLNEEFSPERHRYSAVIPDDSGVVYLRVSSEAEAQILASYVQHSHAQKLDGVEKMVELTADQDTGVQLKNILLGESGYGNALTVYLSRQGGENETGITYFQEYTVELERSLSLKGLTASCGGQTVSLMRGTASGYDRRVTDYTLRVPAAAVELELTPRLLAGNTRFGDESADYQIQVDGETVFDDVIIPLTGDVATQTVQLHLTCASAPGAETVYTLTIEKSEPVDVTFVIDPADALLCIHEPVSGNRIWPDENGIYALSEGYVYNYTLTRYGMVGRGGTILIESCEQEGLQLMLDDEIFAVVAGEADANDWATVEVVLEEAEQNTEIDTEIEADWPDFRGDSSNNAVTDAPIPVASQDGVLYWANKLGEGTDQNATGCPIIVDGDLITYAGNQIFRIDTVTGEIVAQGEMDHTSSFSITPPVYAEGMIFMALSDGTVQAFDAKTLESLWIYEDSLKGQPNTPMTVHNGYLYTGFWVGEVAEANFVCISITDEDPSRSNEQKHATWYVTQKGGFYWAGAYVSDDWLLVGTDDGTVDCDSRTSRLLLLNPLTGKLLDSREKLEGDIRCTVAYDSTTNACYFTSKGGYFYSITVKQDAGGAYGLYDLWKVKLSNGFSEGIPMSTSSPVVYNGRAYIGVSGVGQFSDYSGHNISVIDLELRKVAYRADTRGYPQTSGLLTTAYEEQSGYVYIYFFDNTKPGSLRVLRDRPGQTKAEYLTAETYTKGGTTYTVNTPYTLFTPVGDQSEYMICSPITDEYGTVYFKNDTAYLMAFGSAITKLEVVKGPDKTVYTADEAFDPTGMQVIATYHNGKTRDITQYLTWPELMAGDSQITLTFPYVMYYDNKNAANETVAGVMAAKPTVTVDITVGAGIPNATEMAAPMVNGDSITVTFDGRPAADWWLLAAAYDENGKLLQVQMQPTGRELQQTITLSGAAEAHKVTVFVSDGIYAPAMAHKSTVKN